MRSVLAVAPIALLLAVGSRARASGFLLYEQSGRALGMGAAVSAGVRDASAAWFDPAALAFLDASAGISATGALAWGSTRFTPAGGQAVAGSEGPPQLVPSLYGHVRVHDRVQLGLAMLAPFALFVAWPEGWVGAQQSLGTDLVVLAFNPSVALRVTDTLAVAAGVSFLRADVTLAAALPSPPVGPGGRADLTGDDWAVAANLALLWRPLPDELHVALTYRSRSHFTLDGEAKFRTGRPGFEALFFDQGVSGDLTLPDLFTAGVMWRPVPTLEIETDLGWTLWSAFDRVAISFERSRLLNTSVPGSKVDPLTARLGAEQTVAEIWSVRLGVSFDRSAARRDTLAPSAPDGDRLSLCAGLGLDLGRVQLDAGYLYGHYLDAEADALEGRPAGIYRTRAHALALTVSLR